MLKKMTLEEIQNYLYHDIQKYKDDKEGLQGIFNYSLSFAAILDAAANIIFAGPVISKLLGLDSESFEGKNLFDIICEKDIVKTKNIFDHVLSEEKETIVFKAGVYCEPRSEKTLMIRLENRTNDAFISGIIMNAVDIEEKEKEEAVLRNDYNEFANLRNVLYSSAIFLRTDKSGIIIQVNEKFCEISGYSENEVIGKTHMIINSGYHPKEFYADMWEIISGGKVWRGEIRNKTKNGKYYWVDATITPFADKEGMPFEYIAIQYDITARKEAEEASREIEKRYNDMISNIPDALWQADENGNFVYMSENIHQISGYTSEELVSAKISFWVSIIHREDRRRVFESFNNLFKKNDKFEVDFRIKKKTGDWVWIHIKAINVVVDKGIKTAAGVILDVNDRKKIEIELEKSRNELRETNYQKDKFFSIISHDLRSPFTGLRGFANYLVTELDTLSRDEIRDYLKEIDKTSSNMYNLLNNLLEWSRLQIGRMEFQPMRLSLLEEAKVVKSLLYGNASTKNIELSLEIDPHVFVSADENMLRSILQNLISNAIKFTNSGGSVTVQAKETSELIEIAILDTGTGIDPETLSKIFKIEVTHTTRGTHNEAGAGIGLLLTKELIEKHGGILEVQSKVGEGSKITFTLPKG